MACQHLCTPVCSWPSGQLWLLASSARILVLHSKGGIVCHDVYCRRACHSRLDLAAELISSAVHPDKVMRRGLA